MATYSFLNVNAVIAGPGGVVNLASGAAAAEEGITIEMAEDKNVMTIGADGAGQHSLIASTACHVTVRLLKTSPANGKLDLMYNAQAASAALWGINVLTLTDTALGDLALLTSVAFKKQPTLTYAKEGGMMEWTFDAITNTTILGSLGA
jgi:hypothetical protein